MLIYTHPNALIVENAKSLLEAEGVRVKLKNHWLAGGAGELPPTETWPEVWLVNASDERLAKATLARLDDAPEDADWKCKNCGETNYASFNLCWNCQHRK